MGEAIHADPFLVGGLNDRVLGGISNVGSVARAA